MTRNARLSVVLTHPIQYYAPWFRYMAANVPDMDLKVHYCVIPTPQQQGVGFDEAFAWDGLLHGYDHVVLRPPSRNVHIGSSEFLGVFVPEIAASLRAARPDVVLVPGWYSISLMIAAIATRLLRLPVIYRGDSQLCAGVASPSIVRRVRTRAMLHLFTHYLAVGRRNHDYLRNYSIPESRIFFAPHCVDNDFFANIANSTDGKSERLKHGLSEEEFVVIFAGKLEQNKRPWDVIEAAGQLSPPPTVVVAGSGESEGRCRNAAASSPGRVIFLGFRNQAEIARLYAIADCLVLPSESETWGLVVNEAMAAGLPCIVSDRVGCGPDLVENERTGYVTRFADVDDLSKHIARLRDVLANGDDLSDFCRERADRYSFRAASEGVRAAVRDAMNHKGGERVIARNRFT